MAELTVRFDLKFSARMLRWTMVGVMVLAAAPELASESVSLTTYYPAPSGVYTQLIGTSNAYLARDAGEVTVAQNQTAARTTVLSVNGGISGPYGLTPNYQSWNAFGTGDGGAAIYNDNGGFKQLMVVGNNSAGGVRQVGVWDQLNVNGTEVVSSWARIGSASPTPYLNTGGLATYGTAWSSYGATPEIIANADNHTGGGISISDDGGFFDYNDGPVTFNGSYGIRISGNSGPSSVGGQLFVPGYGSVVLGDASCAWVNFSSGYQTCTNFGYAGWYMTLISGLMPKYTQINNGVDPTGEAMCCPCPNGGCPSI